MDLAISPYHLTTREPAAMAAMLLGTRLLTILPVPGEGVSRATVRRALADCPPYVRLLESWRWSSELWRAGVIRSTLDGRDAIREAMSAHEGIAREPHWHALRRFSHEALFREQRRTLELLCADLLKGGPDPGISVPITAGIDAFAAGRGIMTVRAGGPGPRSGRAPSLAQRAESLLGSGVYSAAVPVFTQAGGGVIARAREMLEPELHALRSAMNLLPGEESPATIQSRVRAAAGRFAEAFEGARRELGGHDDEWGRRVTTGLVRIEVRAWPSDAALRTSVAALGASRIEPRGTVRAPAPTDQDLRALIVTPMDVS